MPEHALPMMRALAPQPPVPPEIEGFLKKLKRKTSNLTGSWNKRWFFVDPKRLEFGYAASRAPNAPKSSIYLNDITAVIQFDETHFQVESRTRNFFLCGESKASTTCWVQSLDEYRKKLIEFEKDMLQRQVAVPAATVETAEPVAASNQLKPAAQKPAKSEKKKRPSTHDANPARDSLQDSSSLSISASSSSNLTDDKPPRHHGNGNGNTLDGAACDEPRTASPTQSARRRESNKDNKPRPHERGRERDVDHKNRDPVRIDRDGRDRERRSHDSEREGEERERRSRETDRDRERERERSSRDRDRDRARERDRDRDSKRDHSSSSQRRGKGGSSVSGRGHTGSRTSSGRSQSHQSQSLYAAHPSHGYVMHAWMDEYE